jgi:hypothetical protein
MSGDVQIAQSEEIERMPHLDDAADDLSAPETFMGLPVDGTWREVSRYQPTGESGHEVVVSVVRMPARFWRVQCPDLDLDLRTGSGEHMDELTDLIASAIATGMLGPATDE